MREENGGLIYFRVIGDDGEDDEVGVKEKNQRQDHGEALMRAAIEKCRRWNVKGVSLHPVSLGGARSGRSSGRGGLRFSVGRATLVSPSLWSLRLVARSPSSPISLALSGLDSDPVSKEFVVLEWDDALPEDLVRAAYDELAGTRYTALMHKLKKNRVRPIYVTR
ncbi:hypothetical protein Sjap_025628 [Stephania japonica]|uniref:Uncharacterized protein n=1 Tax=Stephania japonica TaxID=461633 RepID=A0AAP0E6H0_9MAGN